MQWVHPPALPLLPCLCPQTLEAIKRKQLEKYHKAPEDERESIECNPYVIFHQALENCQPIIGLTSITRGGKTYQVRGLAWPRACPRRTGSFLPLQLSHMKTALRNCSPEQELSAGARPRPCQQRSPAL